MNRIDTVVIISANHTAFNTINDFTACAGALKLGSWPRGGGIKGMSSIGTPGGNCKDMAVEVGTAMWVQIGSYELIAHHF